MLDEIASQLSGMDMDDNPAGLLLLNLVTQIQEHSEIAWTLEAINEVVTVFQKRLDMVSEDQQ